MDESKNPWTVLSQKSIYENDWIRVDHHEVLDPSGGAGIYGTVHFKFRAIGVIPIDEQGNVVLVGQYRFPLNAYSWEIPEGGGADSVTALESAHRELREECGLGAKCWQEILNMDLSNSVSDERSTAFLAWDLFETPGQPESTESLQIERVPFWKAVDRAKVQRHELEGKCALAVRRQRHQIATRRQR